MSKIDIREIDVAEQSAGWRLANLPVRSRKLRLGAVFHRQVFQVPVQVFGEVLRAGVAASRVERQALGDERIDTPGSLRAAGFERGHMAAARDHELDRFEQ